MQKIPGIFFLLLLPALLSAQTLIHAHNDYVKPRPLMNALENRVFSVEADVFLVNGALLVAHTAREIDPAKTLKKLYLEPMYQLYTANKGHISPDTAYTICLAIDIKEKGSQVIPLLGKMLAAYGDCFDRSRNPHAIQVVLSGDRTPADQWTGYAGSIYFDGRPFETYDNATLQRVAFISDNYFNYVDANAPGNLDKLKATIEQIHKLGKPVRFWAAPDNAEGWKKLRQLGADILNTDHVSECRAFLKAGD